MARSKRTWDQVQDKVGKRAGRQVAAEYAHQREVGGRPVVPGHHRSCGCRTCVRGRRL